LASLPNLSCKSGRQLRSSGFMCHPLEHDCYLAKSLDFVPIFSRGGRKTIVSCAFEKVSRHIHDSATRVVLPVSHVAFVAELIVCASKSGDGHLLDLFLRIKRHVDHNWHIRCTDLHRSRCELSKQNEMRSAYDFRCDRQILA
jgi:hypothetical protein